MTGWLWSYVRPVLVLALVVEAACIRPGSTPCGDGTECPVGLICANDSLCLLPAQTTVCASLVDGDRCLATGFSGICDGGLCVAGCGDGIVGDEECDDGNLVSQDGCSSGCKVEELSWKQWESPWTARSCGGIAYHAARGAYVVFGGQTQEGPLGDHWERDMSGAWTRREALLAPPPRAHLAMAYDADRDVIVLFGGSHVAKGTLGDTWQYDTAGHWTPIAPQSSPTPRWGAAMAFVPGTGIVMFGGDNGVTSLNETWIYRDSKWTRPPPQVQTPEKRRGAAMAFDGQNVVLFGGYGEPGVGVLNDTWRYDVAANQWTPIAIAGPPPPRRLNHSMTYIAGRDVIVMFGGTNSASLGDTWEFSGSGWLERLPGPTPPPARECAMMTAGGDVAGRVMLVGGVRNDSGVADLDDVWQLDGTNQMVSRWSKITPRFEPLAATPLAYDDARGKAVTTRGSETWVFDDQRTTWEQVTTSATTLRGGHGTAYDRARDRTVVVGGFVAGGTAISDTMVWDGGTWTADVSPGPSARITPAMTYHAEDGVTVLFGGLASGGDDDETWEWNGSWTQIVDLLPRPPSTQPAMAYDQICKQAVMHNSAGETWAYAGRRWTPLGPVMSPGALSSVAMAFDSRRGRVVVFGGRRDDGTVAMDLWELVRGAETCESRASDCSSPITTWCRVPIVGAAPAARLRPGLTYRANAHPPGMVILNGLVPGGALVDTWLLQYKSSTPDENCANGVDDDTDRRIDAADGDCGGSP